MDKKIRILHVDDHPIVRQGVEALLGSVADFELVGQAVNGIEGVAKAIQLEPDLILLDLHMPQKSGLVMIEELRSGGRPLVPILVMTSFSGVEDILPALQAGASGYLLKDISPERLIQGIRDIYDGKTVLDPSVSQVLLNQMKEPTFVDVITEREKEILVCIAQGLSNKAIAQQLTISERTVRTHVSNILPKIECENRTQAALYALKIGLLEI